MEQIGAPRQGNPHANTATRERASDTDIGCRVASRVRGNETVGIGASECARSKTSFYPIPKRVPDRATTIRGVLDAPIVKRRILEYLGCEQIEKASCDFIGRLDPVNPSRFERHPAAHLQALLDEGCELARSFGDRHSMLVHLDIEYVNFDDPAAAYANPQRAFALQEPLVAAIEARLLMFGIGYLHLVTGQGHHFVWKIGKGMPLSDRIAGLGICNTADLEAADDPLFAHLGLLMEHLAHLIKRDAARGCSLPVEITARHVGPTISDAREMVSIDISEYGDPLQSRMIRIPYTMYRKPWISGLIDRRSLGSRVRSFFTLPLHEMTIADLIDRRHRPEVVLDLARRAGVSIPMQVAGMEKLLDSYLASGLATFHRWFYSRGHGWHPAHGSDVDEAAVRSLPPCARYVLDHPNDLLLKPSGMQLVTRCLLALGWHPRNIAGLITAKFRDPSHEWRGQWDHYDPAVRADFYVRLFAGEIDQRLELGVDFNCVSQQEKGFCWNPHRCSLTPIHRQLYAKESKTELIPT